MKSALSLVLFFAISVCCACLPEEQGTAVPPGAPQAITYTGADITANTQINSSTADLLYLDVSGGSITLSSKTSGPGTPNANMTIILKDTGSASAMNKVIFTPGGSWTIDGVASKDVITGANKARMIRLKNASGAWTTIGGEW